MIVYRPDPVPLKNLGEIINQIANPFLAATLVVIDSMATFLEEEWFTSQYRPVVKYAALHPDYGSLFVFIRRDVNPPVLSESCASGVQD